MIKDFRTVSFESIFNANLEFENIEIIKNKLAENQLLRCNQLIENTKNNSDRILNSIETYSLSLIHISEPTRRRGMGFCGVWV